MSDGCRALVLGGGGVTGVAWQIGMVTGLADAGADVTAADLVVGTSAGSVVGAQITSGADLQTLYGRQLGPPAHERAPALRPETFARYGLALMLARGDDRAFRRRIGALARAAADAGRTPTEAERRATIASRLATLEWPDRQLVITAVDAESGEFRPFDGASGVELVDAVAASCAIPGVYPPVTIDSRRYIDGGVRSVANADLAAGYGRVVVLAPIRGGFGPMASVSAQVRALSGRVTAVSPNLASMAAIGTNVLDPAARAPAARAGRAQAHAEVERVRTVWTA